MWCGVVAWDPPSGLNASWPLEKKTLPSAPGEALLLRYPIQNTPPPPKASGCYVYVRPVGPGPLWLTHVYAGGAACVFREESVSRSRESERGAGSRSGAVCAFGAEAGAQPWENTNT